MALTQQSYLEKDASYFSSARTEIAPVLPPSFERVLEIGCGAGGTMAWLKRNHTITRCVGVDLMPDVIDSAKLVFDEAMVRNIESEPLPDETFDLILALDVLEHLSDPWAIVKRLHALLAPGGSIVVSLPHVGHWTVALPLLLRGQWDYEREGLLDRTHLRFFSSKTAIQLMTSSGLTLGAIHSERRFPGWVYHLPSKRQWYSKQLMTKLLPPHLTVFWHFIRVTKSADGQI